MKIEFSAPTEYDYRKFEDTLSRSCLDGRIKSIGYNIVTDRGDYVPIKNKKV